MAMALIAANVTMILALLVYVALISLLNFVLRLCRYY